MSLFLALYFSSPPPSLSLVPDLSVPVSLAGREFDLAVRLASDPHRVFTKDELLREVWGYSDTTLTRTLDTHVKRLREKLGEFADCIQTVRGVGYRFTPVPVENGV